VTKSPVRHKLYRVLLTLYKMKICPAAAGGNHCHIGNGRSGHHLLMTHIFLERSRTKLVSICVASNWTFMMRPEASASHHHCFFSALNVAVAYCWALF